MEDDMSKPRKATLIEAADYLRRKAKKEKALSEQLAKQEVSHAEALENKAKRFNQWSDHITAAARKL